MSHEVETMAYAGEVPWHTLGNRVDGDLAVDEMLAAAGLDWEVEQKDAFVYIDRKPIKIDRKALIRSTDKKILTVTGKDWKPLQNRDALEFFREYTEAGGATLETAGSLRGGKIIWGLAKLASGFKVNGNDEVNGYILLSSPHEVGKAITVRTTTVRVVCANTLALASENNIAVYRQSHRNVFDMEAARATVELSNERVEKFGLEAQALANLKMSEYDTVRFLSQFFQPVEDDREVHRLVDDPDARGKHLAEVMTSIEKAPGATPGNAWGVLNGVTHWADHVYGWGGDSRLTRSWFGPTGRTKDKVRDVLLELV